jgi:hypothetical protein
MGKRKSERADGKRWERTEGSRDTNDEALASTELGGEVDLVARAALLELDVGDGIARLDHDCGVGLVKGELLVFLGDG